MKDFVSEDDLQSFDVWLRDQAIDAVTLTPPELATWQSLFDEVKALGAAVPKVGLMKLPPLGAGEHRYAVAVEDGSDLWLTLWVKRSKKGEFFVMVPRGNEGWDPHTSYHLDGTVHAKSYGAKFQGRPAQPLWGTFRGVEDLGTYAGHGPKSAGAVCDPAAFTGVVRVAPRVLGPRHGAVSVRLVDPGHVVDPSDWEVFGREVVAQQVFDQAAPWVVVTVLADR